MKNKIYHYFKKKSNLKMLSLVITHKFGDWVKKKKNILFIHFPIYSCGDTFDAMLENKALSLTQRTN